MFLLTDVPFEAHVRLFGLLEEVVRLDLLLLLCLLLGRLMNQVRDVVHFTLNRTCTRDHAR